MQGKRKTGCTIEGIINQNSAGVDTDFMIGKNTETVTIAVDQMFQGSETWMTFKKTQIQLKR